MHDALHVVAEQRIDALRQEAALRRFAAEHRVRRTPVRAAVGRALVRLGERLTATAVRPAATR